MKLEYLNTKSPLANSLFRKLSLAYIIPKRYEIGTCDRSVVGDSSRRAQVQGQAGDATRPHRAAAPCRHAALLSADCGVCAACEGAGGTWRARASARLARSRQTARRDATLRESVGWAAPVCDGTPVEHKTKWRGRGDARAGLCARRASTQGRRYRDERGEASRARAVRRVMRRLERLSLPDSEPERRTPHDTMRHTLSSSALHKYAAILLLLQ
ncbi:hypothetical protein O3G_MSEX013090 [Manduca sexta]|uniref:Uncharacterized protein n=1 Tax=Manduca sexta TaxID=7130 RepID=A0A922CXP8_MANSE|nr:hypothetical protein O3G_MSEX013090 [Manduca sexta]